MGKEKSPRKVADNEALSVGTTIRGSAQKLNLVAALIRGKKAEDARNILTFSKKAMAVDVRKVLESAIANAENNHNLDVDALIVAEASVGKSISMKRFVTRARGRSSRIVKPFSRVRIVVREQQKLNNMGQKSNPIGLRLQINRTWDSRWYAEGDAYARLLIEDLKIRQFIMKDLPQAAISKVVIERPAKLCRVSIYAARPGRIIGKKGADIEKLRKKLGAMTSSESASTSSRSASRKSMRAWLPKAIADQLERRIAFRRAMKRAVQSALRLGARASGITCSGRLGGAEIARTEWYREGRVPLTRFAATSIMPRRRPTPLMVCAASRSGSSRARSSAMTDGPGSADDGRADLRRASGARRSIGR
jgi:small subunit ribosomal protein S3